MEVRENMFGLSSWANKKDTTFLICDIARHAIRVCPLTQSVILSTSYKVDCGGGGDGEGLQRGEDANK